MTMQRIISADSHFVEPPTMWAERMDQRFRDRAPHTVRGHNGQEGEFFLCENITPTPVAGFFGSGQTAEELPRLKLVSAENDISWVPHFLYRLDHAYDRLRHFENLTLPMLPSEYMKRNVAATFQFETTNVEFTRQLFGADNIMWSSDYPHTDSPWPRSQVLIAQAFAGIPEHDVRKIVGDNVARLYHI